MMKFKVGDTIKLKKWKKNDIGIIKKIEGNKLWCHWNNGRRRLLWAFKDEVDFIKPAKPENAREKLKRLLDL